MTVEELREDFAFLEEWEDRFRYIVELGRGLEPMDDAVKTEEHRVQGCQSRVWITSQLTAEMPPRLHFVGDSDSQLVKGLIAVVLDVYNDQPPRFICDYDIRLLFAELNLAGHLTPSRANGLNSLVDFIRETARQAENGG